MIRLRALFVSAFLLLWSLVSPAVSRAQSTVPIYRWSFAHAAQTHTWRTGGGVLSYDGRSLSTLLSPYHLKPGADFAVQARLRTDGPGGIQAYRSGFGLMVQQKRGDPDTAVEAGWFQAYLEEDNNPNILWNGDTAGGAAFDPKTAWHLYRLEVRGDQYRLLIDGKEMVTYTIPDYPNPVSVGVFSTYYKLQVKDFAVYALGAASSPVPSVPQLRAIDLSVSDLPADDFPLPDLSHWYTNEETARERGVTTAAIDALGRENAYADDFDVRSPDLAGVYASVGAYSTPEHARADTAARLALFEQESAGMSGYQTLSNLAPGDFGGAFTFTANAGGSPTRDITVYFTRGRYTCLIDALFDGTKPLSDQTPVVAALAQTVDGRMRQAG